MVINKLGENRKPTAQMTPDLACMLAGQKRFEERFYNPQGKYVKMELGTPYNRADNTTTTHTKLKTLTKL